MPPVRRHNEQLQLVAVSGAAGNVRRTEPQWQEPCSDGEGCPGLMGTFRGADYQIKTTREARSEWTHTQ